MKKVFVILIALVTSVTASASITIFAQDEVGFNATVTDQLTMIDFENIPAGTNITDQYIQGIKFQTSDTGSPLIVVRGNDTYTPDGFTGVINADLNKLYPTSGENILSP